MLRVSLSRVIGSCLVLICVSGHARAQGINLDIELNTSPADPWHGVPAPTYGAASGQAGFWSETRITGPVQLRDLGGALSPVQFRIVNPASLHGGGGIFPINSGDFAKMMNDMFTVRLGFTVNCEFSGLSPGEYEVWTYTGHVGAIANGTVTVGGGGGVGGISRPIAGPSPLNAYALGASHTVHTVNTTGTIDIAILAHATSQQFGIMGFQIVPVPAPGAAGFLAGAGVLWARRRRR